MKAILIDPIARKITEVDHNGDYRQIYEYLSDKDNGLDVDDFNYVQIDEYNGFFVDGEGLLKKPRYFFVWRGAPQPYAGRGLLLGQSGPETVGTTWGVNKVRTHVEFTQLSVQGFQHDEGKTKHPMFGGEEVPFIRMTPIFGPPDNDDEIK